jgi:isopenicillin-N epimerase
VGIDYAFVENATAGCNTLLALTRFSPGDEILTTDHRYRAVLKALEYVASRAGAKPPPMEIANIARNLHD